jgi:hypothetical protein
MIVAGLTDDGIFSMDYTEHIDLMPTLAELAMNATVPACPDDESIMYAVSECQAECLLSYARHVLIERPSCARWASR